MTTKTKTAKRDVYQEVTDQILEQMKTCQNGGTESWIKLGSRIGMPVNRQTKNTYRGINVVLLWHSADANGFATDEWASYKQWQKLGAQVRKGEKGTMITFWKKIEVKDEDAEDGKRKVLLIRNSTVFNRDQVDGAPETLTPMTEAEELREAERVQEIEEWIGRTGVKIAKGGNVAAYSPVQDLVKLPLDEQFKTIETRYSVTFHEMVHANGHEDRLGRDMRGRFGDESYAAEELVAELGAAFLSASHGLASEPREDHAKYLKNWIQLLENDPKAIVTAAARASDASLYLEETAEQD
jgi:antirestriction protein ArdC